MITHRHLTDLDRAEYEFHTQYIHSIKRLWDSASESLNNKNIDNRSNI